MAGALIFPHGHGMGDEVGSVDHCIVTPPDMQVLIGAFAVDANYRSDSGPRVRIALPLPYGRWATAEISLSLFLTAADAFVMAHGDPRDVDSCPRCGSKV